MNTPSTHALERLLQESGSLRRLAGRLVRDAASADDLVQDAVVAALTGGQRVREDTGGWLRGTIRNLARQGYRREGNRTAREESAARPEVIASTGDAVAAAERQRDLAEAVLGLSEPHREVVLLRFFSDAPPRAIAEELGLTVLTVKKRLERGLKELRGVLEGSYGDRGAWAVALVPLCRVELGSLAAKSAGPAYVAGAAGYAGKEAFAWSTRGAWWGAAAVLALLGGGTALLQLGAVDSTPTEVALVERQGLSNTEARESVSPIEDVGGELPAAAVAISVAEHGTEEHGESTSVDLPPVRQAGKTVRFLGIDGEPFRSADVTWLSDEGGANGQGGVSDKEGVVRLTGATHEDFVKGGWTINGQEVVGMGWRSTESGVDDILMVPAIQLAGYVVNAAGEGVAGAIVTLQSDSGTAPSLPLSVLRGGFRSTFRSSLSREEGAFDLGAVPANGLAWIAARLGRAYLLSVKTPNASDSGFELRLRTPRHASRTLSGVVLQADGAPAPGATVKAYWYETTAGVDGSFTVGLPKANSNKPIHVSAIDGDCRFTFVDEEALRPVLEDDDPWIALTLPSVMRTIEGRVTHLNGDPARSFQLSLLDGTPDGSSWPSLELARGVPEPERQILNTNGEGEFRLTRLLNRPYRLRITSMDPLCVHEVTIDAEQSGPLEIELPGVEGYRKIAGMVVDSLGEPVAGAPVTLMAARVGGGAVGSLDVPGSKTVTDEHGAFHFAVVPKHGVLLSARANEFVSTGGGSVRVEDVPHGEEARIQIQVHCELQLSVSDSRVTAIYAEDQDGKRAVLVAVSPGRSMFIMSSERLDDGTFPQLWIDRTAVELVLVNGKKEVRRVSLHLDANAVTRLNL